MSHILHKTEDWHEDMGDCLFLSFPGFDEPPFVMVTSPLSSDFDDGFWTHFVTMDFNLIFEQAASLAMIDTEDGRE